MDIKNFTKKLSKSNIGSAGMHDRYITIPKSKVDPELFFGTPPQIINFTDSCINEVFSFPYKKEGNGEYRLSRFGDYLDKHTVNVDDEIYIEKITNGNYSIKIIKKQIGQIKKSSV